MKVAARLIPRAKSSIGHILLHAFAGPSQPRELPIVNAARSIGREVSDPTLLHQPRDDSRRSIAQHMRAIHEDHGGSPAPCCADALRCLTKRTRIAWRRG